MASSTTTTTTTTSQTTQTGTQIIVANSQSSTQTIGPYVTSITEQPYIANRIVSFYAYNMRPNTLMHCFFNSVNVDQYCAPGVLTTPNQIANTADWTSVTQANTWGTSIYSDSVGQVIGQFNIPGETFKWGTIVFEICNVPSLT